MGGIVIGLMGAAGSGKDTLADDLAERFGVARLGFSWALKRMCADQFGWDFERLNDLDYKEELAPGLSSGMTRRQVLQWLGTEGFRTVDKDHWLKKGIEGIRELLDAGAPGVVVVDVRFPNEVDAIRSLGGTIVRVECPDRPQATTEVGHASETEGAGIEPDHRISARYGDLAGLREAGAQLLGSMGLEEAAAE